jgi:hypothetical protein
MNSDLHSLADDNRLAHKPWHSLILAILAVVESADMIYLQRISHSPHDSQSSE